MRLPAGLTGGHLRQSRQGDPHQVRTPMEVALLSHQSMVIAPLLYPNSKVLEPIESEAHGPLEMFFDARHVIHWAPLFDVQCFLLIREEVHEELFLQLCPLRLLKGGSVVFVVDLDHILQVLLPPSTAKFCCQWSGIAVGGLRPTSPLRLCPFRCRW